MPGTFTVTAEITYRPYRIPPRCRNLRQVEEKFTHEIAIPAVTNAEAPVVAMIPNDRGFLGAPGGGDALLRAYADKLWTVMTEEADVTSPTVIAGSDRFPADTVENLWIEDRGEATEHFESRYRDYLVIDGTVWRSTAEPVYAVYSLGYGSNNGGTYLDIELWRDDRRKDHMFSLTDHQGAIAGALAVAEHNGDDRSYDRIRKTPPALILDPSAFQVPADTDRIITAAREARSLADAAGRLLAGEFTHDSVRQARELLGQLDRVFYSHGLDEVPATI